MEVITNTPEAVTIAGIKMPRWIEMRVEPDDNSVPAKLNLTMIEIPDKIIFDKQEAILLNLSEGFAEVRILILVLRGTAVQISQEGRSK